MAYLVKMIVHVNDDPSLEERVKGRISRSGGALRESECTKSSAGTKEQYLTFVIEEPRLLPAIVRAVERLRGAAIMAVTEPRETKDLHTV